jgi:hypothetical protein
VAWAACGFVPLHLVALCWLYLVCVSSWHKSGGGACLLLRMHHVNTHARTHVRTQARTNMHTHVQSHFLHATNYTHTHDDTHAHASPPLHPQVGANFEAAKAGKPFLA